MGLADRRESSVHQPLPTAHSQRLDHAHLLAHLPHPADVFNWSMTYRTDSDVPVPYGRVLPRRQVGGGGGGGGGDPSTKTRGVALLASNCGGASGRYHYLDALVTKLKVPTSTWKAEQFLAQHCRWMCGGHVGGGTT